jgi:hypothetical protein
LWRLLRRRSEKARCRAAATKARARTSAIGPPRQTTSPNSAQKRRNRAALGSKASRYSPPYSALDNP